MDAATHELLSSLELGALEELAVELAVKLITD
jgi:hypothetical protein